MSRATVPQPPGSRELLSVMETPRWLVHGAALVWEAVRGDSGGAVAEDLGVHTCPRCSLN